ncbi:MAG: diguanylate cyclase, partial [Armatimonadetes bacterium]|nr:diguanylate cyclase [Armatimonadota bacterium]
LDNFKPYNDYYSYQRGDQVLRLTAQLLVEAARTGGDRDTLVVHLGGDDFFIVTTPERADTIAHRALQAFDALIPLHYDEADRRAGHIVATDRQGQTQHFPLMTLSACIATNEAEDVTHPGQIARALTELKSVAKRSPRSTCVRDRRGKYPKTFTRRERDPEPGRRTSGDTAADDATPGGGSTADREA